MISESKYGPPSSSSTHKPTDFSQLLRDSLSLVKHIDRGGIPSIQRSIPQLELASRKLVRQHPPISDAATAQLFLSSNSIDIQRSNRILKDLDFSKSYEPIQTSFNELDVDKFLDHQHNLLITTSIEEANKLTQFNFKRSTIQKMENEWENRKKEILDQLGFRTGKKAIQQAFKQTQQLYSNNPQLLEQTPTKRKFASTTRATLSIEQNIYARVILELNNHRRENKPYPFVNALKNAANQIDDFYSGAAQNVSRSALSANLNPGDITDIFDVIRYMIGDNNTNNISNLSKMSDLYASQSSSLIQRLIVGAKKYSEDLFLAYMKRMCTIQSHQAKLSGKPGILSLIHGYLNLIQNLLPFDLLEQISIDGFPLWPTLFFALRSGNYDTAVQLIQRANEKGFDFQVLADCLNEFDLESHTYKLSRNNWAKLSDEWNRDIASHTRADPYRVAVYHIVGRFRLNQNSVDVYKYIAETTEDYIWVKLSLVYEDQLNTIPDSVYGSSSDKQSLTLQSLQSQLLQRGESHFNSDGRRPLVYFKLLLMAQLFEAAIEYLAKTELFLIAVQVAACLDYYGLLRRSGPNQDLLVETAERSGFAVNFHRIIRKYVESFAVTNPEEAFHYLFLLHKSNSNNTDRYSAAEALAELILSCREYELLVGTVKNNTVQKTGLVYYYYNLQQSEAIRVIILSAGEAERTGLYIDAIELYTLAQQYNSVANILLSELSRLAQEKISNFERQKLVQLATRLLAIQSATPTTTSSNTISNQFSFGSPNNRNNNMNMEDSNSLISGSVTNSDLTGLSILLELVHFFDLYYLGISHYDDALNVVQSLHLFPLTDDSSETQDRIHQFELLNQHVKRVLAPVAIALMDIYYAKYEYVKRESGLTSPSMTSSYSFSIPRDQMRQQLLNGFRIRARALVNFVGMIQFYIGADTNAKLVRLEALMS